MLSNVGNKEKAETLGHMVAGFIAAGGKGVKSGIPRFKAEPLVKLCN
jgi:hypothetical protein